MGNGPAGRTTRNAVAARAGVGTATAAGALRRLRQRNGRQDRIARASRNLGRRGRR